MGNEHVDLLYGKVMERAAYGRYGIIVDVSDRLMFSIYGNGYFETAYQTLIFEPLGWVS